MWKFPPEVARAILEHEPFDGVQLMGYLTQGGTLILASPPTANDDDEFHDLMAITPWNEVRRLRPTAQTEHVEKLLKHGLDWEGARDE